MKEAWSKYYKAREDIRNEHSTPKHTHRSNYVRKHVENLTENADIADLKRQIAENLYHTQGIDEAFATRNDYYMAVAYTVRDRLVRRWIETEQSIYKNSAKTVYYLSAEFLIGRQLTKNLINVGLLDSVKTALQESGLNLYEILEEEKEPGLGNGGLGRLAACFLDSLATLEIPAIGYGIRYEFGIFEQMIRDGWQVERPDLWLRLGNPWEFYRPQLAYKVPFWGHTSRSVDNKGKTRVKWEPGLTVLGTAYDTLVPGYGVNMVNVLRLWKAGASKEFDFQVFDAGEYERAVAEKTFTENISKVLYPNDSTPRGKELRLEQQYFFVSCSLQDIIRRYKVINSDFKDFPKKVAVQLNDTHPSIGVVELMRLLIDIHGLEWEEAWSITCQTFAYTNHTILSEALEKWSVNMFATLLPRHLELIYEINAKFLDVVRSKYPHDEARVSRMSLIEEGENKKVRMANLACLGSFAINGVAALHTELLKTSVLKDFYEMFPEKFSNKTNGITPRRWLLVSNPKLALLYTQKIGQGWVKNLNELRRLEKYADDQIFHKTWMKIKQENKADLAEYILEHNKIDVDVNSIFDVQVKRLHEYKRQLLDVLYIITLYNRLKANPNLKIVPRTFIFGAKSAPGYLMAKLIIKLINSVAEVVNNDPDVRNQIKVVFIANFCVTLGEKIYPAADLSEQISLAGKEASGTGNMKFALNGALTIGTLDGANVEIRDEVGPENFFLFGLTVEQVRELRKRGYNPRDYYNNNHELRQVIDKISEGCFSKGDRQLFAPIVSSLLDRDEYMLLADYQSYLDCQERVSRAYLDKFSWTKMSILNALHMGKFSSDRTITEYCEEIWKVKPLEVKIQEVFEEGIYIKPKNIFY
ncbi:MAG: glycogen/starch/alpha-glucan phosphorylase [Deltaproteobacteria bacterium]|jgi:starch phosphorylase|nr:glycogen/starch/alpha-glucan phosphorylase [Deltaproteobacteria bacterium]